MSGGRRSRDKGARVERGIVAALQAAGLAAVRVPLSGAAGGRFSGDIIMPLGGRDLCLEVKARADGFRKLYDWLDGRDVLIVKADRQEPLVVVRLSMAADLASRLEAQHSFSAFGGDEGRASQKNEWAGYPPSSEGPSARGGSDD